ncbi:MULTISPECIES: DUF2058 domain-containing protein [unclassified Arsukibacterium]|uniref:DUF2058 domain-containing protein n=1 Tax=unclassified Arsukibacterium TaxID=2635278 RepID=UPI000C8EB1C7|nr:MULTISPECIES: DUF2058 domain-containing protein [unclassified Arsukibacterium]MAA94043.1 nucleoprotein/polynucleotide-associated enzyme [Rheinheimera sp.]HAW93831.1 DUF2058 domain-containing protein [Candidatus Azambacteria bacterium]|tara:strand:+ start:53797 stop:54330 length:534 start_codon:yes stop_codon:yes gene_type:complete
MSNAFRDQLLKAGLADAKKVKKVKKEKHQQKTQAGKSAVLNNDASSLAQQAKAEQVARDKELNKQKQAELAQKAIAAQVKQMIETNAISSKGELGFNFVDGKLVKKLYVSKKLHDELSRGLVAIARQADQYQVIPAPVAEKIMQRDANSIVLLNTKQQQPDEDDPYADYQIPDDLMW